MKCLEVFEVFRRQFEQKVTHELAKYLVLKKKKKKKTFLQVTFVS